MGMKFWAELFIFLAFLAVVFQLFPLGLDVFSAQILPIVFGAIVVLIGLINFLKPGYKIAGLFMVISGFSSIVWSWLGSTVTVVGYAILVLLFIAGMLELKRAKPALFDQYQQERVAREEASEKSFFLFLLIGLIWLIVIAQMVFVLFLVISLPGILSLVVGSVLTIFGIGLYVMYRSSIRWVGVLIALSGISFLVGYLFGEFEFISAIVGFVLATVGFILMFRTRKRALRMSVGRAMVTVKRGYY